MPILSQVQIEDATRSKWGGYTNRLSQELLKRSLEDFERFTESAAASAPAWIANAKPIKKEAPVICYVTELRPYCHFGCDHDHEKEFSPQMISSLERRFRDMFGSSAAVDLLNMAERWVMSAFTTEAVGRNGYWGNALFTVVDHQLRATYGDIKNAWDRLSRKRRETIAPPITVVVDNSTDFMESIYRNGYTRVTDKITKLHLNQVREIMLDGMTNGKTPAEIVEELNQLGGREAWHWKRLVRSEMINASQQAAIEEAKASEDVNLQWLTSISKATCKICLERNRKIFDPHKMDSDSYFSSAETSKIEAGRTIKIGRFPHPNCRCSLSPTYEHADWEQSKAS